MKGGDIEQYWVFVEGRRWRWIPWIRYRAAFKKDCSFEDAETFLQRIKAEFSSEPYKYTFRLGVLRGETIFVIR